MEVVEATMAMLEPSIEVVGASTEAVEASMEVSSEIFRGGDTKGAVEVSMEAPMHFRGNDLHGSFLESSGSFQKQSEGCRSTQ